MTRVAAVVGGSGCTAPAAAAGLAAAGFDVALLGCGPAAAGEAVRRVEQRGRRCVAVEAEPADSGSVAAALDRVRTALGRPAVLVACVGPGPAPAGPAPDGPAAEHRYADLRRALRRAYVACQAGAGQLLRHRWGRIIVVAEPPGAGAGAWRTAQPMLAGLAGLTRSAALELASAGITVNLVAPAYGHSPAFGDRVGLYADGVAHLTELLVDERAGGLTGQELYVAAPPTGVPPLPER